MRTPFTHRAVWLIAFVLLSGISAGAQPPADREKSKEGELAKAFESKLSMDSLSGRTVANPRVRALLERADSLMRAGDDDRALKFYQDALKQDPDSAEANWGVARVRAGEGKLDEGERYARRALELDPKFGKPYLTLGNIAKDRGKNEDALRYYRKCAEMVPNWSYPYLNIGRVYSGQKQWEEAESYYLRAVTLEPENPNVLNNAGVLFFDRTDEKRSLEKAKSYFERALKADPRYAYSLRNLANCYMETKDYELARSFYEDAVRVNPKDDNALNGMGRTYHEQKDYTKATEFFRKAIASNFKEPVYHVNLASALLNAGNRADARTAAQRAIEMGYRTDFAISIYDRLGLKY